MRKKKEALSQTDSTSPRISGGVLLPEQLTIADYLEVTGDRSSLPTFPSGDALKADDYIDQKTEESDPHALINKTTQIAPALCRTVT